MMEGQVEGGPTKKRRTNYSYIPEDVKKRVVAYAFNHGTRPAARLFNISEGTIRSWRLRDFDKQTPVLSRGRKVTYGTDLDEELYLGLMAMLSERQLITVDMFTEYSKKIIDERRPELNFKCSRGWIDKFLNRHNLTVTKSDIGKVMHIIECSELDFEHFSSSNNNNSHSFLESPPEMDQQQQQDLEIATNEITAATTESIDQTSYIINNSACSSANSLTDTPTNENGEFTTAAATPVRTTATMSSPQQPGQLHSKSSKIVASGYNSYLPPDMGGNMSEREQRKQRDVAKSRHIMDIVGKLNVVSAAAANATAQAVPTSNNNNTTTTATTSTAGMDTQKRQEVVEYARVNGYRSAERMFGVPKTTIITWVKKGSKAAPTRKRTASKDGKMASGLDAGIIGNNSGSVDLHRANSSPLKANNIHGGGVPPTSTPLGGGVGNGGSFGIKHNTSPAQRGQGIPPTNTSPLDIRGGTAEGQILAWALEKRRQGIAVTFDGLCDQALSYVSQDNPGSAYSSTRRWVDQLLNLKLKDVLNVHI